MSSPSTVRLKYKVVFDPNNGPVTVTVSCSYAATGTALVYYAVRPGDPNILIAEGTLDKQDVRATIPSPVVGSLVTVRCECTAAPGHQQTEVEITFTQDVDTLPVLPDQSPPVPHVPKAPCWHEYRLVTKGNS